MAQIVIGQLALGELVADRRQSHLRRHPELDNNPELLALALKGVVIPPEKVCSIENQTFEVEFPEVIGQTACVTKQPGDCYVWAVPLGSNYYRRYVLNRTGEDCNKVVVVLRWDEASKVYELRTAYIGFAPEKHEQFWYDHVLILPDLSELVPGALTHTRPDSWEYDPNEILL